MVTKLKDNREYILYILQKMNVFFEEWEEISNTNNQLEFNNNFQISFIGSVKGYSESIYKVSFVKDRELLELRLYYNNEIIPFGYLLYNLIIEEIPSQDSKWRTNICEELIDFYISFLQKYCTKINKENLGNDG